MNSQWRTTVLSWQCSSTCDPQNWRECSACASEFGPAGSHWEHRQLTKSAQNINPDLLNLYVDKIFSWNVNTRPDGWGLHFWVPPLLQGSLSDVLGSALQSSHISVSGTPVHWCSYGHTARSETHTTPSYCQQMNWQSQSVSALYPCHGIVSLPWCASLPRSLNLPPS